MMGRASIGPYGRPSWHKSLLLASVHDLCVLNVEGPYPSFQEYDKTWVSMTSLLRYAGLEYSQARAILHRWRDHGLLDQKEHADPHPVNHVYSPSKAMLLTLQFHGATGPTPAISRMHTWASKDRKYRATEGTWRLLWALRAVVDAWGPDHPVSLPTLAPLGGLTRQQARAALGDLKDDDLLMPVTKDWTERTVGYKPSPRLLAILQDLTPHYDPTVPRTELLTKEPGRLSMPENLKKNHSRSGPYKEDRPLGNLSQPKLDFMEALYDLCVLAVDPETGKPRGGWRPYVTLAQVQDYIGGSLRTYGNITQRFQASGLLERGPDGKARVHTYRPTDKLIPHLEERFATPHPRW